MPAMQRSSDAVASSSAEGTRLPGETRVAVALGSNLGDRRFHLRVGLTALRAFLVDLESSSVFETEARYVTDQPRFLNACATGRTRLTPRQLLSQLQDAERTGGRRRDGGRYGPRTLDLDLLLFGDRVIDEPGLSVPHPGLRERAFVLVPLAEIAADWIVPASHGEPATTVAELAARVGTEGLLRPPADGEP
jgi:2-amino-4-hydroxy-6-hydroxymethyldihydropteridine diphosphokinase